MYIRLRTVWGRRSQAYTYVELVSSKWRNGKVRQERLCSLGRLEALRESGTLDPMISKLAQLAGHQGIQTEVPRPATGRTMERRSPGADGVSPARGRDADKISVLRRSPMFSGLNEGELAELSRLTTERRLKAGQFLFYQGGPTECFYVMATGRVKVVRHSSSGNDFVTSFRGPGEIVGNVFLPSDRPHASSAEVTVDARVLAVRNNDFWVSVSRRPEAGLQLPRKMLNAAHARILESTLRLTDLAAEKADFRLAFALLTLFSKFGPSLPFTRQDVAQMSGTSPETASRFVARLKRERIVRCTRGRITVLNESGLRLLSQGWQQTYGAGKTAPAIG
ncbi:MAG: Crp/Fnr family transcriptional regulator [Chloroflexi bacterium]|nr:Crp/Fnr family transcriptional regulator [Chloroflexota bacterium]